MARTIARSLTLLGALSRTGKVLPPARGRSCARSIDLALLVAFAGRGPGRSGKAVLVSQSREIPPACCETGRRAGKTEGSGAYGASVAWDELQAALRGVGDDRALAWLAVSSAAAAAVVAGIRHGVSLHGIGDLGGGS